MRIVVTGGAGFIGGHVAEKLVAAGHEVTIYDKMFPKFRLPDRCEFVQGDVLDKAAMMIAMTGKDVLIHAAAMSNTMHCVKFPDRAVELNCLGTVAALEVAQKVGVKRVMVAGSSLISGLLPNGDMCEIVDVGKSYHLYVTTKLFQEMVVRDFQRMYGLPYTVLRYGICYGPRMTHGVVADIFIKKALAGEALPVEGGGQQWRQYLYVEDLAEAHVLALSDVAENQTYNVVPDEKVTIMDMAKAIQKVLPATKIVETPPRSHDIEVKMMSAEKLKRDLGWSAKVSLEEGIKKTVAWYRRLDA